MTQYRQSCRFGAALDSFSLRAQTIARLDRFHMQCTPHARDRIATLGRWADESTLGLLYQAQPDVLPDWLGVYANTIGV